MPDGHDRQGRQSFSALERRHRMTGVGCFGKPAILLDMLHRIAAHNEGGADPTVRKATAVSSLGAAVQCLIACLSKEMGETEPPPAGPRARVAGFYLHSEGGRARISVFVRKGRSKPALAP